MTVSRATPRKRDWIRFQLRSDHRVLEGFVQQVALDRKQVLVGHAPDSLDAVWYALDGIDILRRQER